MVFHINLIVEEFLKTNEQYEHMGFDVITCGSATLDVFASTESELIKIKTTSSTNTLIAFESGAKILIDELQYTVGGGGTNTAVAFSRLGLKTGYIGALGKDQAGEQVLDLLQKEQVQFLGHRVAQKTGYSIVLSSLEHDRTILTHKGANNHLSFYNLAKSKLQAKWFYFSSMMEASFRAQVQLAQFAKQHNICVAYNPSLYQVKQGISQLKQILQATTVLCFNREEAIALCKHDDIFHIFETLHHAGVKIAIITNGSQAIYCSDGVHIYTLNPQKVACVDPTGAGDAFAAGFVAWFVKTKNIEQSLQAGLHNSQSILKNFGAKGHLLTQAQMKRMLKKPVAVRKRKYNGHAV